MVLTEHGCLRILVHHSAGHKVLSIKRLLEKEGIIVSRIAIWKFLSRFKKTDTITRKEGSGRKSLLTHQIRTIVEETMDKDDETTAC